MEEIIDFDKWQETYIDEIKYIAVFDPESGQVVSVGPYRALKDKKYKLEIDKETAEDIIEGKIKIHNCYIDTHSQTLEIAEIKQVYKLDDVLHRIVSRKWSEIDKPDIHITKKNNEFLFQLTEEFGGTYKQLLKHQPIKQRKILWDGDTNLNFLITDYNDPNILYKMITIKINDLIGNFKKIKVEGIPEQFSIYTRRIFKDYVIE